MDTQLRLWLMLADLLFHLSGVWILGKDITVSRINARGSTSLPWAKLEAPEDPTVEYSQGVFPPC